MKSNMVKIAKLRCAAVYDLPPEVLESLTLKEDADAADAAAAEAAAAAARSPRDLSPSASSDNLVGTQACSLCTLTFPTLQDQRSHLKSDLHHYNLKQKLRGLKPVSEVDFEKLIGDLDESLSGSDSEDSEDEEEDGKQDSTLTALLRRQARLADKKDPAGEDDVVEDDSSKKTGASRR